MSHSSPDIAGLIAQANQIKFFHCVTISGTGRSSVIFAIMNNELHADIEEIWNSKFTGAQALFLLTRYAYLVHTVFNCINGLTQSTSETLCRVVSFNGNVWSIMTGIGIYGFLTLRTYAIYQKKQIILVILGLPCVLNVAIQVYILCLDKPGVGSIMFVGTICGEIDQTSVTPRFQLAGTINSLILAVLVFTLTFAKTIHHATEMRKVGLGNGLGYFILRDGTMYFLAHLLFGVAGTILFVVPASSAIGSWLSVLFEITNSLTVILINRLVLNLRQVSHVQEGNAPTLGAIGTIQEPAFATNSILGNLGAPLRVGLEEDDEFEEMGVDDEAEVVEERETVNHTEIIEEPRDPSDV